MAIHTLLATATSTPLSEPMLFWHESMEYTAARGDFVALFVHSEYKLLQERRCGCVTQIASLFDKLKVF